ncbi:MAG: hypothetical protein ABSA72_10720 [Nitrososphaerales archaeon]|jgi:hypothetical protein
MSHSETKKTTVMLYVCRFCGKVGVRLQPAPIELGGCAPPNVAHAFESLEVVIKPKA